MHEHTVEITLTKPAQRKLQAKALTNGLTALLDSFNTRAQKVSGWELVATHADPGHEWWTEELENGDKLYHECLTLRYSHATNPHKQLDVTRLLHKLAVRCPQPVMGRWTLDTVDGYAYETPAEEEVQGDLYDAVGYANCVIPEDWDENFTHLYGLGNHIERIRCALEAGMVSGWQHRFNCALIGPPACGKSDIAASVKRALGDDAVIEYDATATTGAGAISDIMSRETLPRVLIVEEIEKADPKALDFLLAILDLRGEVRKVTARENIQRDAKLFAICTVNNRELFEEMRAGALASRFSNKIVFKRPTRETLVRILVREVDKVDGNHAWIEPCVDFCERLDITDPRMVTAHCLCGRDKWLDGSYAKMLAETSENTETVLATVEGR